MSTIRKVYGYLARFETARDLYHAAEKTRDKGFSRWDAYTPFPVHGMDAAMGLGRSRLPWFVFFGGTTGFLTAVALQFFTQVYLYPTVVQSKPANLFTIPAFFPVMFELTILFSAFTTLFGLLAMVQLPRFNHPLFDLYAHDRSRKTVSVSHSPHRYFVIGFAHWYRLFLAGFYGSPPVIAAVLLS